MLKVASPLGPDLERIVSQTMDCGFTVHRALGPGFKELIYQRAFRLELESRQLKFECEKPILVHYKNWSIPGQKIDLVVEQVVLIEIKAVPRLRALHRAQAISYLRTTGLRVGLLMNFNSVLLKDGFQRILNAERIC